MWKSAASLLSKFAADASLLTKNTFIKDQIRTTYVLKRKNPPLLHKKGGNPKKMKSKHYIYEVVSDTSMEKQSNIDVVLTEFVDGLGNIGQTVSVKPFFGYNHLILPGRAVYASPENIQKYKDYNAGTDEVKYSSAKALLVMKTLSRVALTVVMNKDHPWTIKPWHVSTSFRKCGYIVPEYAITLPDKPISGPDLSLQGKEFYVTVTINKTEKVNVRCILHHWSTDILERLPWVENFWENPSQPIYDEFSEVLKDIPRKPSKPKSDLNVY